MPKRNLASLLTICFLAAFYGCAPLGVGKQESLLTAAGFRVRTPRTPQQQELYASVPSYKLLHGTLNGQSVYGYKDRWKGVAYIGGPTDYHRYQELSYQERQGRIDYVKEEMSSQMASSWYQAWAGRAGLGAGPLEVNTGE